MEILLWQNLFAGSFQLRVTSCVVKRQLIMLWNFTSRTNCSFCFGRHILYKMKFLQLSCLIFTCKCFMKGSTFFLNRKKCKSIMFCQGCRMLDLYGPFDLSPVFLKTFQCQRRVNTYILEPGV